VESKITKLLVMQFSPASCYFFPVTPKVETHRQI